MESDNPATGVPKQVFEQFLTALEAKAVSADVISRLRKTLLEQGNVSVAAIDEALFPDNDNSV